MKLSDFQNQIYSFLKNQNEFGEDFAFIQSTKGINNRDRLESYKYSFENRIYEVMEKDFEVYKALLSDDEVFELLVACYFVDFPPDTHFINEVGKNFSGFILQLSKNTESINKLFPQINPSKKNEETKKRVIAHLDSIKNDLDQYSESIYVELAKIEYAMTDGFYQYYQKLKSDNPRKLFEIGDQSFIWNSSYRQIKSNYPLHLIWYTESYQDREVSYVGFWSLKDRRVMCRAFSELEFHILDKLMNASSFEDAIEQIDDNRDLENISECIAKLIPKLIEAEILFQ